MEAALKDFIDWMQSLPIPEIKYYAVFDPADGKILGIYPDHSCTEFINKIEVDEEIAYSVLEGKTLLNSYIVNTENNSLEIIENKSLTKIDDVLHRIIDQSWTDISDPDVTITVTTKKVKITLSEKYYKSRKIYWDGSTEMLFLITDYNDPNSLHDTISITIDRLFEKKNLEFELNLPKDFSIYTRRIFKNYVMSYENN